MKTQQSSIDDILIADLGWPGVVGISSQRGTRDPSARCPLGDI